MGYSALALTEHGNVSSHFQFEKAAKKAGIKPIFGLEAYCGPVDEGTRSQWKNHLTVLAMNDEGYRNLNKVVTQSYRDFYYHPTVSGANLTGHQKGIVVLSGCAGSLLACTLLGGKGIPDKDRPDLKAAQAVTERFRSIFGDRYYLEVQGFPELDRTAAINEAYEKLSKWTGIPLAATIDVHYPEPTDNEMQVILHACGRGGETAEGQARKWNYDVLLTLPESDAVMYRKLRDTGLSRGAAIEAIEATGFISDGCNVTLPKADRLRYPLPEGVSAPDMLVEWLRDGWRYRKLGSRDRDTRHWFESRVKRELGLFLDKDLSDFLPGQLPT